MEQEKPLQNIYFTWMHPPLLNLFWAVPGGGGISLAPWGPASCLAPWQWGKQRPVAAESLPQRCCKQFSTWGVPFWSSALLCHKQITPTQITNGEKTSSCCCQTPVGNLGVMMIHITWMLPQPACFFYSLYLNTHIWKNVLLGKV